MATNNQQEMAIKCSFFQSDPHCSKHTTRRCNFSEDDLIPLTSCDYDVSTYLQSLNLLASSTNCTEPDLILNRGPSLQRREDATVCPYHRYMYGIGFYPSRSAFSCGHPNHEGRRKCDRTIGKDMSENIKHVYNCTVPIGTRICRTCRSDKDILGPSKLPPPEPENPANSSILDSTLESAYADDSDYDAAADMTTRDVTVNVKEVANDTFSSLAELLNQTVTDQSYVLTGEYTESDSSTKHALKSLLRERCLLAAQSLTPNHYEDLFDDFIASEYEKKYDKMNDDSWIATIATLLPTLNKSEKIMLLSIFAFSDTKKHLVEKFQCSDRVIRAARKHARDVGAAKQPKSQRIVRHRLSLERIEHFLDFLFDTQLQTMSWGKMKMKFSDQHVEELAPVLCTNIPAHIIHLYYTYCQKEVSPDFKPLSYSTLWKILAECPRKTKKSMSGLDDYMADGLKGFIGLHDVLSGLKDAGLSNELTNQYKTCIEEAKQYLKGQYPINVSTESSSCADHCRIFALSDEKKEMFRAACNHEHSSNCSSCEKLDTTFENLEATIISLMDESKRDELLYDLGIAKERIIGWKMHIIRAAQQQLGKDDILKSLSVDKGLLIIDWGMKCLPQEYLETSKNWYGKRGMSWSFACLIYKEGGTYKKFTYVVCVEKCIQDWWSNSAVLDSVLAKIKADHPEITKLIDKHDNAGCYHNCYYWLAKKEICDSHSITLEMTLMNEPCKGKDECDRMISKCRNHLRYYVNAGNKVTSASEMRDGLLWMDGVKGVSVSTITVDPSSMPNVDVFPFEVPDVTKMFVIKYKKDSMLLHRAYKIGAGNVVKYPKKKLYKKNFDFIHEFSTPEHGVEPGEVDASKDTGNIWHCPNSACLREFKSLKALRRHTGNELCTYKMKRTSMDVVKHMFSEKLDVAGETMTNVCPPQQPCSSSQASQEQSTPRIQPMGWALKSRKPVKRFSKAMLAWVKGYFLSGEITGKKITGEELNRLQRTAIADDKKMFPIEEYKTDIQFKSLLSRLTGLYKNNKDAFSDVEIANAVPRDVAEIPTDEDEYSNITAAAAALDGVVADLKIGDFISFANEKLHFWLPGVINEISENECMVKSMKRTTGDAFVWPSDEELVIYSVGIKDILYILEEPVFHRRYWSFSKENLRDTEESYAEWQTCRK